MKRALISVTNKDGVVDFCNSDRVICKENGEPILPKSFTRKWGFLYCN